MYIFCAGGIDFAAPVRQVANVATVLKKIVR